MKRPGRPSSVTVVRSIRLRCSVNARFTSSPIGSFRHGTRRAALQAAASTQVATSIDLDKMRIPLRP
jgi:hypothetical protein